MSWVLFGNERQIADDFAGMDAPKLKFNFTVQFVPRTVSLKEYGNTEMESMAFGLKTATRPKPSVEYEKINFYGFRTQVATKVEYGTASLTFYDDVNNKSHDILHKYLSTISPLFGKSQSEADNLDTTPFANSTLGALTGNRHGPFKAIIVTHHYNKGNARKRTTYEYLNPKFIDLDFGDLEATASEVTEISMTFNYDTINIKNT